MTRLSRFGGRSFERFVEQQERDPEFKELLDAERRRLDEGGDCPGCGAPAGYPPAGPCQDHGTGLAVPIIEDPDA